MKKTICLVLAICLVLPYISRADVKAECFNQRSNKFKNCIFVDGKSAFTLRYKNKNSTIENITIKGDQITSLASGEYARRRVAESVVGAVVFAPVALFGLFSKKKREQFGIEFNNEEGLKETVLFQVKPKYALATKLHLEKISNKQVEDEHKK